MFIFLPWEIFKHLDTDKYLKFQYVYISTRTIVLGNAEVKNLKFQYVYISTSI